MGSTFGPLIIGNAPRRLNNQGPNSVPQSPAIKHHGTQTNTVNSKVYRYRTYFGAFGASWNVAPAPAPSTAPLQADFDSGVRRYLGALRGCQNGKPRAQPARSLHLRMLNQVPNPEEGVVSRALNPKLATYKKASIFRIGGPLSAWT